MNQRLIKISGIYFDLKTGWALTKNGPMQFRVPDDPPCGDLCPHTRCQHCIYREE